MGFDEWCTPPEVAVPLAAWTLARYGRPEVGLDPCSNERSIVQALVRFHAAGLQQPWDADVVYENPPYSRMLPWSMKAVAESTRPYRRKPKELVRLVPCSPSTEWWDVCMAAPIAPMVIITSRLRFIDERGIQTQGAKFDTALMVWAEAKRQEAFLEHVAPIVRGVIMPVGWRRRKAAP